MLVTVVELAVVVVVLQNTVVVVVVVVVGASSSSSCMHVTNHNWSATKRRLHLQSVAEISCHLVL